MAFTHLHVHTEFSLLDGSNKITEYLSQVKKLGMNSAAITDHGVMYGVIDFYKEAKKQGIKPILGCEVYVAPGSRFDKSLEDNESKYYHLILLAENNIGYNNLMKIVSIGFVDGFYYKPRVDRETLEKYSEGIICLSACLAGEVARLLQNGQYDKAKEAALWHEKCFGKGNYFLELQDHGILAQQNVNRDLLRLSEETGIELVATNDVHYTYQDDVESHDILLCIQTGKRVNDEDRMRYEGGQYYLKSEDEMRALFPYAASAIDNTYKIAERCNVEIEFGVTKLPHFEVPQGYDSWTYLNKLCKDGLVERYGDDRAKELMPRLDYELNVIKTMGYVDYFLIVWDFINYARMNDIPVGPGRGSAAGALVSYTTGITDIDPIKYNLLFERFLNPERVSMPDIDIDFSDEKRSQVIEYVVDKYGADCVTQIVTFGTLAARNVIRDVGRVLDLPYAYVDKIAKSIPKELNITIDLALKMNPELQQMYEEDETVKHLIDMARRLEGLPRNTSMHAAGVVISQKPMDEYVPLAKANDGTITTQFIMTTIEELGLLKMDFLGLRTLSVIDNAIKTIKNNTGKVIDFDELGYDDKKVFELIGSGHTEGIFQLESAGMKSFMKELKPESLEDVIAGISLYRPGPMDFIPDYISGKNDKNSITYLCPELEPILAPTYGCIVYQEQVMQIVRDLAGYSMGRSDLVRRAMSKKKDAVMQKERANFVYGNPDENVKGCVNNGISEEVANVIYDKMIDFAKYAFNKSHAACYAVVAYQTAYLKAYYPVEFMAALMSSVINNTTKVAEYIFNCKNMGIEVLPPDVNSGEGRFSAVDGKIRYGMYAIKSVGTNVIDRIVKERCDNGEYSTLENFINRVNGLDVNKRAIENLIKAGAFDGIEGNRRQKMAVYGPILDSVNNEKKKSIAGQMTLFDIAGDTKEEFEIKLPPLPEYDKATLLEFEKEVLNIYVSGHPLEEYEEVMAENVTARTMDMMLDEESGNVKVKDNSYVTLGGMITNKTIKFTKNNKAMAFITVEDLVGQVEVIVFPNTYDKYQPILNEDSKVLIYGKVNVNDDADAKLICERMILLDDVPYDLWIRFDTREKYFESEAKLNNILSQSEGNDAVKIYIKDTKERKSLPANQNVSVKDGILPQLINEFGEENVIPVRRKWKNK